MNIALYELLAFVIVLAILGVALKILMVATSVFEKLLKMTIILGIPSKIMGAVVGAVEAFVIVFIALYVLSLPIFNISFVENSKWKNQILNNTPVLSAFSKKTMGVVNEFAGINLIKKF